MERPYFGALMAEPAALRNTFSLRPTLLPVTHSHIPYMAVRPRDQLAAILVILPLGYHLYVDPLLDAPGDEHAAK